MQIKGHPTEDAVLCTTSKTYAMRSVVLSNSVLVVKPQVEEESGDLIIEDSLNEVLELVPIVPKVHVLRALLRGREYDGEDIDGEASTEVVSCALISHRRLTIA
jgi:sister chromatid cohesion protein DCC1